MENVSSSLIEIAGCLLLSAFTSGAETALTALGEPRARQFLEEKGHRSLKLWVEEPARVLATLLVTNTAFNTLTAALATSLIEGIGAKRAVALATGAVTLLTLTFGEITPKTLAQRYAAVLAPVAMGVVLVLYYPLYPFTAALLGIPRAANRMFTGGGPPEERKSITSEEIEYMIDLGAREGILEREKSALLKSVLEFSDTITREIMVPRLNVVAIPVGATRAQVMKVLLESQHSRVPVFDGSIDEVVGVLHAKSLFAELERGGPSGAFDLKRYTRPPFFVPELMKIGRLLREFQKRKMHLAIVVDEFGGTAGIVSLEDVVEEIVGEIQDEQDVEEGRLRVLPNGTIIADATLTLRDLEDPLGIDFPEALDYDSLGGFVTATAGKVPPVGSVILWGGLRFTVRAGDERRVTRVEIARVPEPAAKGSTRPETRPGRERAGQEQAEQHDGRSDERR